MTAGRPGDMPKLRDQTLRFLNDPTSRLRTVEDPVHHQGLDVLADQLRVGELYWATADMTALAVSSGAQLAAASWAPEDRPTPSGLLMFDGGAGSIDSHGVSIPIEACAWGPAAGQCAIWLLLSRRRLVELVRDRPWQIVTEEVPPLIPVFGFTLPVTSDPVPMAEVDPNAPQPVVAALAASWLLMQQHTLVHRTQEHPGKSIRRAYARQHRPAPSVTLVDLRRQYIPHEQGEHNAAGRYRHRWVVSGHWRQQPHGPGRTQRRQQWIPSHLKGPDGAPLLSTERVNVWRR